MTLLDKNNIGLQAFVGGKNHRAIALAFFSENSFGEVDGDISKGVLLPPPSVSDRYHYIYIIDYKGPGAEGGT